MRCARLSCAAVWRANKGANKVPARSRLRHAHRFGMEASAADALCLSSHSGCVDELQARLSGGAKYHALRDALRASLGDALPSPPLYTVAAVAEVVRRAAEASSGPSDTSSLTPLFHVLLEALGCECVWARPGAPPDGRCALAAAAAAQLLSRMVCDARLAALEPRAALRLAQAFQLTAADCDAALFAAADAYAVRAFASSQHSPAVLLSLQLRLPSLRRAETLPLLLSANHEALAESLAEGLGEAAQRELVRCAQAAGRYRTAVRAVRRFRLHADFPDAEALYRQSTVERMMAKGAWEVAAAFAADDGALRAAVLAGARAAGEPGVALELGGRWGAEIDPGLLAEAEAAEAVRSRGFWRWPDEPPVTVELVERAEQLPALAAALRAASAVGLDAEWRAECHGGAASGPGRLALLQLAPDDRRVFLLDIPRLVSDCPGPLAAALAPALRPTGPLLLGVAVRDDLAKLARDWGAEAPALAAAALRARPADLRGAWAAAGGGGRGDPPAGLSALTKALLGLPLDKRLQMSDWERRPLSEPQLRYAASDALAALLCYRELLRRSAALRAAVAAGRWPPPAAAAATAAEAAEAAEAVSELTPLGVRDVEAALTNLALSGSALPWRLVRTAEEGPTCDAAAAALGVPAARVVKSLALFVSRPAPGGAPNDPARLLLLLSGEQRADVSAAARHLGLRRGALRFASAAECVSHFGFPPGSMAPVGHRPGGPAVRVLMDAAIAEGEEELFAGAGATDAHLAMLPRHMLAAAGAEVAQIASSKAAPPPSPAPAPPVLPPSEPAKPIAFMLDGSLNRLGRWLRCLGVDAETSSEGLGAAAAAASAAGRVLLTASLTGQALQLRSSDVFYVGDPPAEAQLERVRANFRLAFDSAALLSRCASCNGVVATRLSAAQLADPGCAAAAQVPAHIRGSETEVWACDDCGKAYWVGPKSRRAVELAARLGGSVFGHSLAQPDPASSQLAAQIADVLASAGVLGGGGRGRRLRGSASSS